MYEGKTLWFVVGSQSLYGEETLRQAREDSRAIAEYLGSRPEIPVKILYKDLAITSDHILSICKEANNDDSCVGIITWMHTFSPAQMWIKGLKALEKPMLHLHTQFNRDLPWDTIDMDFMNLNQSAHGDREFGFICSRLRMDRKVVTGYWQDDDVIQEIASWARAAAGWDFSKHLRIARLSDNMREVAVTEGDKVEAHIRFGWQTDGYVTANVVDEYEKVTDAEVDALYAEYQQKYVIATDRVDSIKEQAKIEIALRRFLEKGGYKAFTTNFQDLHGLKQLPGMAVQRLTGEGYGFGGEGDWKTAALCAIMKYMSLYVPGESAFMEDYTYHMEKGNEKVLEAHMLEVCPAFAADQPKIEVHPLGIGDREDPARLTFKSITGNVIAVTIIDMGNRFRMIANTGVMVPIENEMPHLPVAQVLWQPAPNLKTSATAWIQAGGAHHTCMTTALTVEDLRNFAMMAGMEFVVIDENTEINSFVRDLKLGELLYR